jgi:hypothetical protein
MTHADNSRHLLRAAAMRHEVAVSRARAAIDALNQAGGPLNISAVARSAGVSRSWLYSQPELRETIETLRTNRRNSPPVPSSQRATPASLRERLDGLRDQITRLQSENARLRDQLARRLGQDRTRR